MTARERVYDENRKGNVYDLDAIREQLAYQGMRLSVENTLLLDKLKASLARLGPLRDDQVNLRTEQARLRKARKRNND